MKIRLVLFSLSAGLALLLSAAPAPAHHAFAAEFDSKKPVKVTGTISKVDWRNPHAFLYLDVKESSGTITNWRFEMSSPNELLRAGWTRNSMKPGDVITVEGLRAKDGSTSGDVKAVTLNSTGQRLLSPGQGQPQQ